MITAVVVDNGEPTLIQCLESLLDQTLPPNEIILAPGPETPEDVLVEVRKLGVRVLERLEGIGVARVNAVLRSSNDLIVSCDSDTVYERHYVEYAAEDLLNGFKLVKAGRILPREINPLALIETVFTPLVPYEFALAFRRSDFLKAKVHLEDYSDPRSDVGFWLSRRFFPPYIDFRMECYTKLPTYAAAKIASDYLGPLIAGSTPLIVTTGLLAVRHIYPPT